MKINFKKMNKESKIILGVLVAVIIIEGYLLLNNSNKNEASITDSSNKYEAGLTDSSNVTKLTDSIKIGVITPLTGVAAAYGAPARDLYLLAASKINNNGGINGKAIQLIVADGECREAGIAKAAQKLINVEKVQVIIGGFCSSESAGLIPIANQAKIAVLSPVSVAPQLSNVSPFFARNSPSASKQGIVLADVAYARGFRKIAVIQEKTDYSLGLYNSFDTEFKAKGGITVRQEFVASETDTFNTLTSLQSSKPDALFIITQAPLTAEPIFIQLRKLGWKPNLFISDSLTGLPEFIALNKDVLDGAIAAENRVNVANPKLNEMISKYKELYGVEPPNLPYAPAEYDSVFLVADAIRAVGYDGTKIANWFRTNVKNWQGAAGSLTIGSDGDSTAAPQAEVIRNGKVEPYLTK